MINNSAWKLKSEAIKLFSMFIDQGMIISTMFNPFSAESRFSQGLYPKIKELICVRPIEWESSSIYSTSWVVSGQSQPGSTTIIDSHLELQSPYDWLLQKSCFKSFLMQKRIYFEISCLKYVKARVCFGCLFHFRY